MGDRDCGEISERNQDLRLGKITLRIHRQGVHRVRVLSIPGPRHAQNSYFPLLWHALEGAGLEMIDARTSAAIMLKFDVLHMHFPQHVVTERSLQSALVAGPLFLAYVVAIRVAGKKLVWTIHEIAPKRRYWLAQPLLLWMCMLTNT